MPVASVSKRSRFTCPLSSAFGRARGAALLSPRRVAPLRGRRPQKGPHAKRDLLVPQGSTFHPLPAGTE
jgi:hypothetical protein